MNSQPGNFRMEVMGGGFDMLAAAVELLFLPAGSGSMRIVKFSVNEGWLHLLWGEPGAGFDTARDVPFDLDSPESVTSFLSSWLTTAWKKNPPPGPGIDGSTAKGWELKATRVGYAVVSVRPAWAEWGK
jgi:hypothetical protein